MLQTGQSWFLVAGRVGDVRAVGLETGIQDVRLEGGIRWIRKRQDPEKKGGCSMPAGKAENCEVLSKKQYIKCDLFTYIMVLLIQLRRVGDEFRVADELHHSVGLNQGEVTVGHDRIRYGYGTLSIAICFVSVSIQSFSMTSEANEARMNCDRAGLGAAWDHTTVGKDQSIDN
ncbi:hypothetical protein PRIPAC_89500 [Pristionchus pacificus]|uniref:Uncharacterized protein n=1 Tax=Pristionchus pacificus TaxID=54126 RepID=A0A2A6CW80_PRIPA|nr:hypothetical protein PRIPAC_89500 [Pristionchus pacificus]|eukprot:PDM82293.1 hypothetical protein PRIPAC_36686 [Pristionchus pacificus]